VDNQGEEEDEEGDEVEDQKQGEDMTNSRNEWKTPR